MAWGRGQYGPLMDAALQQKAHTPICPMSKLEIKLNTNCYPKLTMSIFLLAWEASVPLSALGQGAAWNSLPFLTPAAKEPTVSAHSPSSTQPAKDLAWAEVPCVIPVAKFAGLQAGLVGPRCLECGLQFKQADARHGEPVAWVLGHLVTELSAGGSGWLGKLPLRWTEAPCLVPTSVANYPAPGRDQVTFSLHL